MKLRYILFLFSICFVNYLSAQNEWYEEQNETETFTQRLWYGGGIGLGFAGTNGDSEFNFGLFPMVGYKITENFSLGPRVGFDYSFKQVYYNGQRYRFNPIEWSVGAFARVKIFRILFGHLEYEYANEKYIVIVNNQPTVIGDRNNNVWIGGGYNPGGFEFAILYNLNENKYAYDSFPIIYRAGFTINF